MLKIFEDFYGINEVTSWVLAALISSGQKKTNSTAKLYKRKPN